MMRGPARWWARGCALALAVAAGMAVPAERELVRVSHHWETWRRETTAQALASLKRGLDDAIARMTADAHAALAAPDDRERAFDALARLTTSGPERGVVLYQGDSALAWSGVIRAPFDPSRDGVSIIATQFYLAFQMIEHRGDRRAVEVALLDAAPPADKLSAPLTRQIAERAQLDGLVFSPASDTGTEVLHYRVASRPMFDVRAAPLVQDEMKTRITERTRGRAGLAFLAALGFFVIGVWRATRRLTHRIASLATGLACTALVPLNQYSNLTRVFDPAFYFTPRGGPLTGNAGALFTTSALVLLGILAVFRRQIQRASRWPAIATVVLIAGLGPFLLRELARGIQIPLHGVGARLWLIWEVPLFLAAVSVLLVGAAAGAAVVGPRRGLPAWVAPLVASVTAVIAPVVWEAPGRWPWWYTLPWIAAIAMLAFSRRSRAVILSASAVAALGATTLVWGRASRGRVDAAVRDLEGLSQVDSVAVTLLRRLGESLSSDAAPSTREALLKRYVQSDVAPAGNPIVLSAWPTDAAPTAAFATAQMPVPIKDVARIVADARRSRATIFEAVPTDTAVELVMAAPSPDGGVTAVVLAPKSRLFEPDPFARLLGLDLGAETEPPYTVRLRERAPLTAKTTEAAWRRDGTRLHGDWVVRTGTGAADAHVEVELRPLNTLVQRGALLVLFNLAIVELLWLASIVADGGGGRWLRARRRTWGSSYRARLSLALFLFFVIPAAAFAIWSYGQLSTDTMQSRSLLLRETLRALNTPPPAPAWLPAESTRLDAPLLLYYRGLLSEASDPLYEDIAPTGRFLNQETEIALSVRSEGTDTRIEPVGAGAMLFGFRSFADQGLAPVVIGTPARANELTLDRRRRDLGVLVAFATAVGALAAFWLSGLAARQLARPIGTLRHAALAIASGSRLPPLEAEPTVEFNPVFTAFRRMASDLHASRTELEEAQRRTTAVLRNVASGVVAVDPDGKVSLANPRAEQLLGHALPSGTSFATTAPAPLATVVERFLMTGAEEEHAELAAGGRQLRCSVTRLARGGAVVTLDDVTELARAQRVLAWGEMARQVAHEIKNPLTPIRLGVQHLRRARADARVDFDRVLDHNVNQILAEIDRLDEIARAFSRYGAAPGERARPDSVDVAAVVREVVSLERMGAESELVWEEEGVDAPVYALALAPELKEVLLNVLENARHAAATRVCVSVAVLDDGNGTGRVGVSVRDDGHGIPADVLPRVFEPHFSTRTSGSGLGLAISRQLVEGWGGSITVESAAGRGTTVEIRLREATRSRSTTPSRSAAPEPS
jgi:two-component system, NtrC family, nitrogen regulation sensor histidine kinase NtrY